MESKHWTGDDTRDSLGRDPQEEIHYPDPDGNCDCHCPKCGAELSRDPIYGTVYAQCGDCYGGREPDGEVFRGREAAAYERDEMARMQRTLK